MISNYLDITNKTITKRKTFINKEDSDMFEKCIHRGKLAIK